MIVEANEIDILARESSPECVVEFGDQNCKPLVKKKFNGVIRLKDAIDCHRAPPLNFNVIVSTYQNLKKIKY